MRPVSHGLPVLGGLGAIRELEEVPDLGLEGDPNLGWSGKEELLSAVGMVDSARREMLMQFGLERHGVLRKEQRVNVEPERDRGPTELKHTLHRLQADPTVSYGCVAEPDRASSCLGFDGTITRPMLEDANNRYNTYRHGGLPPGPIANPGLDAIKAVLEPEVHDYLYFVARGGRRHSFSVELGDHHDAVDRYRYGQN